jgi:hypothetical protein
LKRAGWTPVPAGSIPQEFLNRIRLNPDTLGVPFFAFNEHHVPLPLYPPSLRPSLQNAQVKWFDIRTGSLFHEPPKEFLKKYGANIHQPEHPYYIYAELFSESKVNDISTALSNI